MLRWGLVPGSSRWALYEIISVPIRERPREFHTHRTEGIVTRGQSGDRGGYKPRKAALRICHVQELIHVNLISSSRGILLFSDENVKTP